MTIGTRGLLAGLSLTLAAAMLPAQSQAQEHHWRVQTIVPAGSPNFENLALLADDIAVMSGGRLTVEFLPAGAVVAANGTLDAVRAGVIEGHVNYPFNWAGIEPGFAPMGDLSGAYFDPTTAFAFYYQDQGMAVLQQLYDEHEMHVIGIDTGGTESLPTRKPIHTLEDLKGMTIRVPTGITSAIMEALGASPVSLPFAEAFSALEKGAVDASDAGALALNMNLGMYNHAKFSMYPGFHSTTIGDFSVNKAAWDALSPDLQRIVQIATENAGRRYIERLLVLDAEAAKQAPAIGLTLIDLPAEERAKYRAAGVEVWETWAQQSPLARQAIDAHLAFLRRIGVL